MLNRVNNNILKFQIIVRVSKRNAHISKQINKFMKIWFSGFYDAFRNPKGNLPLSSVDDPSVNSEYSQYK